MKSRSPQSPDPRRDRDESRLPADAAAEADVLLAGGTMALPTRPAEPVRSDTAHYLVVREGPDAGERVEIGPDAVYVGRAGSCHFRLRDEAVSGRHCVLSLRAGEFLVNDLGSTNGTYLDGKRLRKPGFMKVDSVLQIGSSVLWHETRSRDAVARASVLSRELAKARGYVEALLPAPLREGNVRSGWCFEPSAVLGGDAFGHHRLADGRLAIYLVDVCGHGPASALHAVSVINSIRRQALAGVDFGSPASVLAGLNGVYQMNDHDGMFFTAWYGVYDPGSRSLAFAAAGHPAALLLGRTTRARAELVTRGMGVGMLPVAAYDQEEVTVAPGSRLYVYSDGVFEIRTTAGDFWRQEDFQDLVAAGGEGPEREAARIREGVRAVAGTGALPDDFSLMVFEFP